MKFSKYPALISLAFSVAGGAAAHDAWLEITTSGEVMTVEAFVGHAEDRAPYDLEAPRIASFVAIGSDGISDHASAFLAREPQEKLVLAPRSADTALLALTTFRATSTLEAEKFNAYLVEEGIAPILHWRAEHGEINEDGREVYSRFLKALVPDPSISCDADVLGQPLGQILEIIPLNHPGSDCSGDLGFELRYFGEPVEGATLHFNRTDELQTPIKARTGPDGRAVFDRPTEGIWYVHAAWSMPVDDQRFGADFATSFASFSFASNP